MTQETSTRQRKYSMLLETFHLLYISSNLSLFKNIAVKHTKISIYQKSESFHFFLKSLSQRYVVFRPLIGACLIYKSPLTPIFLPWIVYNYCCFSCLNVLHALYLILSCSNISSGFLKVIISQVLQTSMKQVKFKVIFVKHGIHTCSQKQDIIVHVCEGRVTLRIVFEEQIIFNLLIAVQ